MPVNHHNNEEEYTIIELDGKKIKANTRDRTKDKSNAS